LVAEVATRYTDIVTADRVLNVHGQNIKLAEQMLVRNKELLKSKEGLATDVTTAELALYQRQDQYITSAADKIERVNTLFALTNREPDLDGETRFKAVSSFFSGATMKGKRELINDGQSQRLDLNYYKHVVETAKLNVLRAKDVGKSQLNVTGSAGLYGLDAEADGAFDEAAGAQGTEWSLGLNFKMPLGEDGAAAALEAAEAQVRQAQLELARLNEIFRWKCIQPVSAWMLPNSGFRLQKKLLSLLPSDSSRSKISSMLEKETFIGLLNNSRSLGTLRLIWWLARPL